MLLRRVAVGSVVFIAVAVLLWAMAVYIRQLVALAVADMAVGTRSVLYGAHCFLLHPWFVAWAWWQLYGFPWDPRLWVAFFVHDLGYWGKPNMDGSEGELHPLLGARLMAWLFDGRRVSTAAWFIPAGGQPRQVNLGEWGHFALLHSRYLAKRLGLQPSRLCMADKLAIALTPAWMYLPMVRATGEMDEYMAYAKIATAEPFTQTEAAEIKSTAARCWYAGVQSYCRRWAYEHRDGKADKWTSATRRPNIDGVWQ